MITLYGFDPSFGVADPSPFVLKLDLYMKIANIPFERINGANNLSKAPKGKLPFIEDDGKLIADSAFILEHLQAKHGDEIDSHLSEEQKATAYLISKSLDENFYWCIVHSRWVCEKTWPIIKESFFGDMPFPLKQIVPAIAQKGVKKSLLGQGTGKHNTEEVHAIADSTLKNLSILLGDKSYFFGDQISSFDAVVFSFLAQVTVCELDTPLHELAKKYDNLMQYCQRIQQSYYGEMAA